MERAQKARPGHTAPHHNTKSQRAGHQIRVSLEAGEPLRLQLDEVRHGTKAIQSLMGYLGMVRKSWSWREPQPVYYDSVWVCASRGGILLASVALGDQFGVKQRLGVVADPVSNAIATLEAPRAGRVIGMAVNQMVLPGYAVFRIGTAREEADITRDAQTTAPPPETETPAPQPDGKSRE